MKKLTIILLLLLATAAFAQPPRTMNFQGTLADGIGMTLPDGNYNLTFRLWNADVGGATLWTEARSVALSGGIFSIGLGEVTPLALVFDQPYWLGIQVGGDAELSPRSPLTGMPYALNVADGVVTKELNGLTDNVNIVAGTNISVNTVGPNIVIAGTGALTDADWDVVGSDMTSIPVGNVGIGVAVPGSKLDVSGAISSGTNVAPGGFLARVGNGAFTSSFGGAHGAFGSQISLAAEDGNTTFRVQPDVDGTGGFVDVLRNDTSSGFMVDGNYGGTESALVTISGTGSTVNFRTDLTGDLAVMLPPESIVANEIADEPGVASELSGGPISLTTTRTTLISRTIVCPTAGYVFVQGMGELEMTHTNGAVSFGTMGVSDIDGTLPLNQDQSTYLPSGAASGLYLFPSSPNGLFEVAAGSNTFYLVASINSAGVTARVWDMQLSCIFFPTSYGTITPTKVTTEGVDQFAGSVLSVPAPTRGDLAAEQAESEAFARGRVDRELAIMQRQLDELQSRIDRMNTADGVR